MRTMTIETIITIVTILTMQVVAGVGMDGVTAVVEHLDLRQEETSHWQQGVCPGHHHH